MNATAPSAIRYSTVAIALHWLIAILLVLEVALGLRMESLKGPDRFAVFQLHKSIGITILLLIAIRLAWRIVRKPPPLMVRGWQGALAHGVHILFYVLLFVMPLSGWAIVSTSRIAVPTLLYGVVPWPHLPGFAELAGSAKARWHDIAEGMHVNLVKLIYLLFALHVAGALKHHFLDRDATIARMAPGTRPGTWADPRLILIALGLIAAAGLGLSRGRAPAHADAPARTQDAPAATIAPLPVKEAVAVPVQVAPTVKPEFTAQTEAVPSWTIEKGSTIGFTTSWSGTAIVGGFSRFDGEIAFSPEQLDRSRVAITIRTGSIFTGDSQRDETLQGVDWFAVASYGTATFTADRFRATGPGRYIASGILRLKGVTLPLSLPFTLRIDGDDATMRGSASIDRTKFKIGEGDFASTSEIPAQVRIDATVHAKRDR